MTYNFVNTNNGDAFSMFFETDDMKKQWLKQSPNLICLGVHEYTLPTRHVRMNSEVK